MYMGMEPVVRSILDDDYNVNQFLPKDLFIKWWGGGMGFQDDPHLKEKFQIYFWCLNALIPIFSLSHIFPGGLTDLCQSSHHKYLGLK